MLDAWSSEIAAWRTMYNDTYLKCFFIKLNAVQWTVPGGFNDQLITYEILTYFDVIITNNNE